MRELLIKALRSANRLAKRALGVDVPREPAPPMPAYMALAEQPAAYAKTFTRGACVFVLEYATRGQGGLADVLDLAAELERQYGIDAHFLVTGNQSLDSARENIRWMRPSIRQDRIMTRLDFAPEFLCATAWPTAYRVRALPSARKLYFVQDYEPLFHRAGVMRTFAERTYHLGLQVFTLGPWLAHHLAVHHGIKDALAMPFTLTGEAEGCSPLRSRNVIAMYVQPDKAHRGTELMVEVARRISREIASLQPAPELVLFGSVENEYLKPDFPCTMRGMLSEAELNELFRRTRVGICASFTNVSLLTLRFIAHGCATMDLNLPGVTMNVPAFARPLAHFYEPLPDACLAAWREAWAGDVDPAIQSAIPGRLALEHSWKACAEVLAPLFRTTNEERGE